MRLKWYGHASFRITSADGITIITDPYTPERAGYRPVQEPADVVIVSSDNDTFHCRYDLIPGNPAVINALELAHNSGKRVEKGIPFQAVESMEALEHRGGNPDQNAMYRFEVDGLHIGHMGDMGNALSEQQLAFFEGIDILLALAGGYPTIALDDLASMIETIKPRLVVPMHFRTLRLKLPQVLWLPSFLAYFDEASVFYAYDSEIEITEALLDDYQVCVLAYV